ncbi:PH domain-containing protein [Robbsia sp. Bb-Pol-6]|uniref:PH domain-containing protein n=1 Tax=Robbsia betulipollinis TaxID=2981849 RepID=A0ABT3ZJV2_9BURK|nr:PH domain-containing protein [Robbsia betulipollinis]MCY0386811.1 PH domain-containing protein [Robbsia betulipollinis]
MTQLDLMANDAAAQTIIFKGAPSQVVNAAAIFKGVAAIVVILAATLYASGQRWQVPWAIPVIAVLVVMAGVGIACLRTAFTEIIIDTERITLRQGIFNKRISSLELFRIQDLTSYHPWWQRAFNVGTIVVMTSDSNNPVWRLNGIVDAEAMRAALNHAAIALRDRKGIREVNMGRV